MCDARARAWHNDRVIHGDLLTTLAEVVDRLNELGIDFMVTGSLALGYYVEPRMTRDIDLVIELDRFEPGAFIVAFRDEYYVPEELVLSSTERGAMFNIIREKSVVKVDFVVRRQGDFRAMEFGRRRLVRIDEIECPVVAAEDLILSKLLWLEQTGSAIQSRDVKSLLETAGLDRDYLLGWAARLGVRAKLEELEDA